MFQLFFGENENDENQDKTKNQDFLLKKDVYTFSNEPTNLQKREKKSSQMYTNHYFLTTPTLSQGNEFNKLQGKIKTGLKKKVKFVTEGFGSMDTNNSVNNTVQNTATTPTTTTTNTNDNDTLINEHNILLGQFKDLQQQIDTRAKNTVQRINPSNPYFNQNILFSTGHIAYVTEKGIVKLYPDTNTFNNTSGINNCPSTIPIQINLAWDPTFAFPGTIIPTTPPLMSGTPMKSGQTCGNEDSNVYVNEVVVNPSSTYLGCYKDNTQTPTMTALTNPNGSQLYNYSTCLQGAIDNHSDYYSLQNMDPSTGFAQCNVSDDLNQAQTYGEAINACNQQSDGYIYGGPLQNAAYKTPTATYIGTYRDPHNELMTPINDKSRTYNYNSCYKEAIKSGNQYFSLHGINPKTQLARCFVSNDFDKSTKAGHSNKVILGKDGKKYGGSWTNAIYEITPEPPYLGCFNDSTTNPAMTAVNNGSATYTVDSCKEYAQENNFSFFGLQGVTTTGNPQAKCMVSNSLDNIQKYDVAKPCNVGPDGFQYGNIGINALYQVTKGGDPEDIGKIGYVDQNGILSEYPDSASKLSTTYTTYTQYDSYGNDIPNASYGNSSDEMCRATCNNMPDCYGYVFKSSDSTCYPKNSNVYPNSARQPTQDETLHIRDKILTPGTAASNRNILNIDSNTWSNYVNSGKNVPDTDLNIGNFFGFSNVNPLKESFTSSSDSKGETTNDPVQQNILSQLEDRLNLLTQQINSNITNNSNRNENVNQEFSHQNNNLQDYMNEYEEITKKLKEYSQSNDRNLKTILKETDILMVYKNYTYLLYAFLLIGVAIFGLKIINSKK